MLTAESAVFAELQLFRLSFLILGCRVISLLALGAAKRNDISHCSILCMNEAAPGDRKAVGSNLLFIL
jgi:hypothetical protein